MRTEKKNRFYEESLPAGYREALVVDAGDRRVGTRGRSFCVDNSGVK